MAKDGKTHIFRAKTYTEAVSKARNKLGKDISIVTRRDIQEGSLFSKLTSGKLGGLAVELEVTVAKPKPKEEKPAPIAPNHLLSKTYAKALEGVEKHTPAAKQAMIGAALPYLSVGESAGGLAGRLDDLKKEMEKANRESSAIRDELRSMLSLQARGGLPTVGPDLLDMYRRLTEKEVDPDLARDMVEEIQRRSPGLSGIDSALAAVRQAIAGRIPSAGPVLLTDRKPTVVAVIGPSGVGKSTALAKLAIEFAVRGGKTVGLINEDLRRPGADRQLTNLANLINVPLASASEPREVADAVKSMAGRDLILIDTAGRSPRDAAGLEGLASILRGAGADETHLVLSCVGSEKMLRETAARYRVTGFNRVILSKLDEAFAFGCALGLAANLAEGLSYVASGPDYMKPIQPADSERLADLVLGLSEVETENGDGRAEDNAS